MKYIKNFNQMNEKVTYENAPFQTSLTNKEIIIDKTVIDKDLYDSYTASCEIFWDFELETGKKSGIRGITPLIREVVLTIDYEMYKIDSEDELETITNTYNFEIDDIETQDAGDFATIPYEPTEIAVEDNMTKVKIIF